MNGKEKQEAERTEGIEKPEKVDQSQDQQPSEDNDKKTFSREELASAVSAQVDKAKQEMAAEFKKTLADEIAKARKDGEDRAKMTAEQRAEDDRKRMQQQLAQKQADIEARERKLNTRDALNAAGLHIPNEDVDLFVQKDTETTHRMIDRFKKLVQVEVSNQIHERTANRKKPEVGADPTKTVKTNKPFEQMSYAEKRELFQEDPAAYQALKDKSATK